MLAKIIECIEVFPAPLAPSNNIYIKIILLSLFNIKMKLFWYVLFSTCRLRNRICQFHKKTNTLKKKILLFFDENLFLYIF